MMGVHTPYNPRLAAVANAQQQQPSIPQLMGNNGYPPIQNAVGHNIQAYGASFPPAQPQQAFPFYVYAEPQSQPCPHYPAGTWTNASGNPYPTGGNSLSGKEGFAQQQRAGYSSDTSGGAYGESSTSCSGNNNSDHGVQPPQAPPPIAFAVGVAGAPQQAKAPEPSRQQATKRRYNEPNTSSSSTHQLPPPQWQRRIGETAAQGGTRAEKGPTAPSVNRGAHPSQPPPPPIAAAVGAAGAPQQAPKSSSSQQARKRGYNEPNGSLSSSHHQLPSPQPQRQTGETAAQGGTRAEKCPRLNEEASTGEMCMNARVKGPCHICGDKRKGERRGFPFSYTVLMCESCRKFTERHLGIDPSSLRCTGGNSDCEIIYGTVHCYRCRWKKIIKLIPAEVLAQYKIKRGPTNRNLVALENSCTNSKDPITWLVKMERKAEMGEYQSRRPSGDQETYHFNPYYNAEAICDRYEMKLYNPTRCLEVALLGEMYHRPCVQSIDGANQLKEFAQQLCIEDQTTLVGQCISRFLLMIGYASAKLDQEIYGGKLLVGNDVYFPLNDVQHPQPTLLEAVRPFFKRLNEKLVEPIRKLDLQFEEYVLLRQILLYMPHERMKSMLTPDGQEHVEIQRDCFKYLLTGFNQQKYRTQKLSQQESLYMAVKRTKRLMILARVIKKDLEPHSLHLFNRMLNTFCGDNTEEGRALKSAFASIGRIFGGVGMAVISSHNPLPIIEEIDEEDS